MHDLLDLILCRRMFDKVAPLLEALAEFSRDDVTRRDAEAVAILTSINDPRLPWIWPPVDLEGSDRMRGGMPVLTEREECGVNMA